MLHAIFSSPMVLFLIVDIDICMFYRKACMHLIAASFPRVQLQHVWCAVGKCLRDLSVMQAVVNGAALHQCAWLLHIAALQLHRADMALPAHREDCQTLLQAFFGVPQDSDGDGVHLSLACLYE